VPDRCLHRASLEAAAAAATATAANGPLDSVAARADNVGPGPKGSRTVRTKGPLNRGQGLERMRCGEAPPHGRGHQQLGQAPTEQLIDVSGPGACA